MSRTRLLGFAAVAALAAAVAMPSPASASRKAHLLKLYKVEQHVDLEGQDGTYSLQCNKNGPGANDYDLALDGMYRIDDVEQDNDYWGDELPGNSWSAGPNNLDHADWDVLRSVRPVQVKAISDSKYQFKFTPLAGGDVQMKLWITCLGWKTEPNSHTVSWSITPPTGWAGWPHVTHATSPSFTTPANPNAGSCPSGSIVVQPGFSVQTGDAQLVASYPTGNDTQWNWTFQDRTPLPTGFDAELSWNCLALKSTAATDGSGHKHRIVRNMAKIFTPASAVKPKSVGEKQAICGEHYKGMIGGWDYTTSVDWPDRWKYLWFLGMDPRIKSRAFKFINKDANQWSPDLYLVCFKDKTT